MPVLKNQRHERFAQELARGRAACHAYEAAGYQPDRSAAAKLSANVHVLARVRELQGEAAEIAVLDKAWVLKRLMANVERSMQAEPVLDREGKPTGEYRYEAQAANRALELLGKELGMFVERSESTNVVYDISPEPMSPEEWAAKHAKSH